MTEWEDGINRYVFNLNGSEACVLYYDKEYGYYARSYLDSGAREERFPAGNLESAKSAAEKWYAELLKKSIDVHKRCIAAREKVWQLWRNEYDFS